MKNKIFALITVLGILMCSIYASALAEDNETAAFVPGQEYKDVEFDADGNIIEKEQVEEEVITDSGDLVYYNDISDYTDVGILGVLGIMEAYSEDSFKPNVYISRLEFVESLLKVINVEPVVMDDYGTGVFYDVEKTDEFYATVYTAAMHGIADDGFDNNTFRPNSVLTYDEAIVLTMKALGYGNLVQSMKNVITYEDLAYRLNLLDDLTINNYQALTRGEVASLLANALETPLYSPDFDLEDIDSNSEKYKKAPLYLYFDMIRGEGIVTATRVGAISGSVLNQGIAVDGVQYSTETDSFNSLLGYKTVYYRDYDAYTIRYMYKHRHVVEKIITDEEIDRYNSYSRVLRYENDGKTDTIEFAGGYKLFYNGQQPSKSYDESIFNISDGKIKVVSNDRGNTYSVVFIEEYVNYILKNVTNKDNNVYLTLGNNQSSFKIDVSDVYVELYDAKGAKSPVYAKDKNGNYKVQISGFASDSVISVYFPWGYLTKRDGSVLPQSGYSYVKIVTSATKVNGRVTAKSPGEYSVTVSGEEKKVSRSHKFEGSQWTDIQFGEVSFYADAYGKLVGLAKGSTEWKYAFLIMPYINDLKEGTVEQIKLCTSAGKVVKYLCGESLQINGKKVKGVDVAKTLSQSASLQDRGMKYGQAIKYKLDAAEETITAVQTITASIGVDSGYSEEHLQRVEKGIFRFMNDGEGHICDGSGGGSGVLARYFKPSVILAVSATDNDVDSAYSLVLYKSDMRNVDLDIYDVTEGVPAFVIHFRTEAVDMPIYTNNSATQSTPVMLSNTWLGMDEEENVVLRFSVAQQGTVKEYYSENLNLLDNVESGQLMYLYGNSNTTDKVTSVQLLKSSSGCKEMGINISPSSLDKAFDIEDTTMTKVTPVGTAMSTYTILCEPYMKTSSKWFILQRGSYVDSYKREQQIVGSIRNNAFQHMGVFVWYENNGKPYAMNGTIDDMRFAAEYGSDASKVVAFVHEGTARGYAIYNFDE